MERGRGRRRRREWETKGEVMEGEGDRGWEREMEGGNRGDGRRESGRRREGIREVGCEGNSDLLSTSIHKHCTFNTRSEERRVG